LKSGKLSLKIERKFATWSAVMARNLIGCCFSNNCLKMMP
jgi:hypothetical protein